MCDHEQTAIIYPGEKSTMDIDEGIAPLIQAMWEAGILTSSSCQEIEPGIMWIEFPSSEDLEDFLTLLTLVLDDALLSTSDAYASLRSRILGKTDGSALPWRYEAHPLECRDEIEPRVPICCGIALTVSAMFPVQDYPLVLELLDRYLNHCSDAAGMTGPTSPKTLYR